MRTSKPLPLPSSDSPVVNLGKHSKQKKSEFWKGQYPPHSHKKCLIWFWTHLDISCPPQLKMTNTWNWYFFNVFSCNVGFLKWFRWAPLPYKLLHVFVCVHLSQTIILVTIFIRPLGYWGTRTQGHQDTGTPGHKDTGTPGHQDTGTLEHGSAG